MHKTLTKADIVEHLSNEYPGMFSMKEAQAHVESLLELIKKTLESGEDILISGFGKFCVVEKGTRKGRNPATGDDMMLRGRRIVTFRCSQKLRDQINRRI
jgi:integration host factor subunit alpha